MPAGPPTKRAAAHEPSIAAPWAKTSVSWKNHLGGEVQGVVALAPKSAQVKSVQVASAARPSALISASKEFQHACFLNRLQSLKLE